MRTFAIALSAIGLSMQANAEAPISPKQCGIALPTMQAAEAYVEDRFRAGEVTMLDVLSAKLDLLDFRLRCRDVDAKAYCATAPQLAAQLVETLEESGVRGSSLDLGLSRRDRPPRRDRLALRVTPARGKWGNQMKQTLFIFAAACALASYARADETIGFAGHAPGGGSPGLCQPEGQACHLDFDCCQGVCKNGLVLRGAAALLRAGVAVQRGERKLQRNLQRAAVPVAREVNAVKRARASSNARGFARAASSGFRKAKRECWRSCGRLISWSTTRFCCSKASIGALTKNAHGHRGRLGAEQKDQGAQSEWPSATRARHRPCARSCSVAGTSTAVR